MADAPARTLPDIAWLRRLVTAVHRFAYRATGGRVGAAVGSLPMLLLTTTGRRSGEPRHQPLLYLRDEGDFIVIASNWGQDHHPAWYLNLRDDPDASVRVGRHRTRVRAEELEGDERREWYERGIAAFAGYRDYREKAQREIPVLRLRSTRCAPHRAATQTSEGLGPR